MGGLWFDGSMRCRLPCEYQYVTVPGAIFHHSCLGLISAFTTATVYDWLYMVGDKARAHKPEKIKYPWAKIAPKNCNGAELWGCEIVGSRNKDPRYQNGIKII